MADSKKVELKKGRSQFMLIGEFKPNNYVYDMNKVSNSGFCSNRLNLPLDCGNDNIIYSELWGGFSSTKPTKLYVHGRKMSDDGKKEIDDWKTRFEIDFEDRNKETIIKTVGDRCFIEVGIEKDMHGKTVVKRFLSPYDAVKYVQEVLEPNTPLNVRGDLEYSIYNDNMQVKKKITSIFLSGKEKEDYKAEFIQTILVDKDSFGKIDDEKMTIEIDARVLDYNSNLKKIAPYNVIFEVPFTKEDKEHTIQMSERIFQSKKDINAVEITGQFIESVPTINIQDIDLSDDVKFMLEIGKMKEEDVIAKAVGNQKKVRRMLIKDANMRNVEVDGNAETRLAIDIGIYKEEDLIVVSDTSEVAESSIKINESDSSDLNSALTDLGL